MGEARTVVLVDDDAATREILLLMLTAAGWAVVPAESGGEALDLLRELPASPSLVLCDLQMPGLCGRELAAEMRVVLGEAPTVLLAMTGTPGAGVSEGYDGLLIKPFEAGAVEALWRRSLSGLGGEVPVTDAVVLVAVEAAIDAAVWRQLRGSMPGPQLQALYAMALADAEMRVRRMEAAVEARDDAAFRREAHALKGSCGMVGAQQLGRLAAEAEAKGFIEVIGNKVTLETNYTRFREEIWNFRHMLEVLTSRELSG